MKKILIAATMILLTGCSTLVDGIMGNYHNYDPVEYNQTVNQVVLSRSLESKCDQASEFQAVLQQMTLHLRYSQAYLEGRPYNKRTLELNRELLKMVEDTAKREKMSVFFCRERSKNIVKAAEILRDSSGEKRE